MRDVSGQRAKTYELGIAHASSRIHPFPLTTLPISYSRKRIIPAKIHLKKGKRWNGATIEMKNKH
jgi:hypothetical protein